MIGPDGIPFMAWRALGPLAEHVLYDAFQALAHGQDGQALDDLMDGPSPELQFNASLMVFLPKSPTGRDPHHGDFFQPADTRPLNIVNADNRILANAVRLRVEPILERWVSPEQRGFLPGRSMIQNVVEVDHEMMRLSLQREDACAIFFDFKAAFTSVAHEFLKEALSALGLPNWLLRFVFLLYRGNRCRLIASGAQHEGFELSSGIRQGCPLSPLLFAVWPGISSFEDSSACLRRT